MKNKFPVFVKTGVSVTLMLMLVALRFNAAGVQPDPGIGGYSVTIPPSVEARIVKEEADNCVKYKFKKSDGTQQFLFSINKLPYAQWTEVRALLPDPKLIGEKNGDIYYAELTTRMTIKDAADKQAYAEVISQLDNIISSIRL